MSKTVAQVMTHNPIMVNPQTPLKQAIQILAESKLAGYLWLTIWASWWGLSQKRI